MLALTINISVRVHDNVTYTVQCMHARRMCQGARSSSSEEHQLQAKKLTIYFMKTTNVSVVLWELSPNIHTLYLKKNPSLSLLFIESSSGTVEGGDGKQITPYHLNKAFQLNSHIANVQNAIKNPIMPQFRRANNACST